MSWMVGMKADPLASLPPEAQVSPTPPLARQGLLGGPDFRLSMEQGDPAVDGSDAMARSLSPFTLWAEPPPFVPQSLSSPGTVTAFGDGMQSVSQTPNRSARASATPSYVAGAPPSAAAPRSVADLAAPQITDRQTALSILAQLGDMRSIPPLVLLINPETMTVTRTKLAQLHDRSRYGFIYQPWGEEPSKISFTARCGAFYTPGRGVHVKSRLGSAAWQSMMSLLTLYKNNSYVQDVLGDSYSPLMVGRVGVRYGGWTYRGHLDDLSWTEEEGSPLGGIQFEVTMTATTTVDTSPLPLVVLPLRGPNGQGATTFTAAPVGGSPVASSGGGPPALVPPLPARALADDSPVPFIR